MQRLPGEAGVAHPVISIYGPASPPYPHCATSNANYVKIKADSDGYYTVYIHVKPSVSDNQHVSAGQQIGTLDNSGCQSAPHLHVQREDGSGNRFNFEILGCTNPLPTNGFADGLADDNDPDY